MTENKKYVVVNGTVGNAFIFLSGSNFIVDSLGSDKVPVYSSTPKEAKIFDTLDDAIKACNKKHTTYFKYIDAPPKETYYGNEVFDAKILEAQEGAIETITPLCIRKAGISDQPLWSRYNTRET